MSVAQVPNTSERSGILLCLVGPAGVGKTTISQQLIAESRGSLAKSVSATSRKMRSGEIDGESYHFVSRADFEKRVAEELFFEWEEVHGNLYGTLRATLDEAVKQGRDLVLDIDIRGALNLRRHYQRDLVTVFVLPPSGEILRERILGRGSLGEGELERRLETAKYEYARIHELHAGPECNEYFVVNEQLAEAVSASQAILDAERRRFHRFSKALVLRVCGPGGALGNLP